MHNETKDLLHIKTEASVHNEPAGHMLNEHLWALVLQHLDSLRDRVKASACCQAAWKAGLLKVAIPFGVPSAGMSQALCINLSLGLCVLHINMTGIVIPCSRQHEGQRSEWTS